MRLEYLAGQPFFLGLKDLIFGQSTIHECSKANNRTKEFVMWDSNLSEAENNQGAISFREIEKDKFWHSAPGVD